MIEFDREQAHQKTIAEAGAIPIGERSGFVWFTDPTTKTSLVLEPEKITVENVTAHLTESRRLFAAGRGSKVSRTLRRLADWLDKHREIIW